MPGHNIHNMKFTILEEMKSRDPLYGREREKLLIRKFDSSIMVSTRSHDGFSII